MSLSSISRIFARKLFRPIPRTAPTTSATLLTSDKAIEEEMAPCYQPKLFYPVQIYEILNNRYQVAAKLGWGTSSTVWLAQDLNRWRWLPPKYVVVKVLRNDYTNEDATDTELRITKHVTESSPQHRGRCFVRTLLDSFDLSGPSGTHVCMVFEPLLEPLWLLQQRFQGNVIPSNVLKVVSKMIIEGLSFLHTECHIIHTDLKPDNTLMGLRDQAVLHTVAQDEAESPLPQKKLEDRTIYLSRNYFGVPAEGLGVPVITDLGLAVRGDERRFYDHLIQPDQYCAPEVILAGGWSYSADLWNLAALLWDLLEGRGPFDTAQTGMPTFSNERHLANMIALLGAPPLDVLKQGKKSSKYFDNEGRFKFPELIPKERGLANSLSHIEGDDKMLFLEFISKMLRWRPAERGTIESLRVDPWLPKLD
ncbi:kinase-like protein [Viridothelium virens]|uniref:non-specific serine/threonine protein kinase n=1 Tax=Viridothelium virens TaxID=1048519 RepID=A0A6A6H0L2_VIRVR|nr:kinase-like protein [Viridothelium virens]